MNKKNLLRAVMALTLQLCAMPVAAQAVTAQQASQDSVVNVIAYFCKNDTMCYQYQDYEAKVEKNDTIVDHYIKSDIQLVVVDSTEYSEAKITYSEQYNYFYNGWPCEMTQSKLIDLMGTQTIEIKNIVWNTRRWSVYEDDDSSTYDGTM